MSDTQLFARPSLGSCSRAPRSGLLARLTQRLELARTRRALLSLESHLLNDIGLSEAEAQSEARRSVWDAPDAWHR